MVFSTRLEDVSATSCKTMVLRVGSIHEKAVFLKLETRRGDEVRLCDAAEVQRQGCEAIAANKSHQTG